MAQVTLAVDPDGRHVVLKRIRGEQANDAKLVQMFLDEAKLAMSLRHPNIVEVFDSGASAGEYFFAMEYVHGEDLRRVLQEIHERRDQLPVAQVLTLIASAAAGLHHAHELCDGEGHPLGIVHRDVSPANILVGYDGSVKVTDFGIAKATLQVAETRSGVLKGKVSYMSPEQVTGRDVDRRSDVFALGVVFYEVATARRLFKNDNDFLTMSAIVQGQIPPPREQRPDLPFAIEKMIMKCLAANPRDRFASARELHEEIDRFMRSLGQKTSAIGVADYMKKLFGYRAEPWLTEDTTVTTAPSIDFDGSDSGVVAPPPAAVQSLARPRRISHGPASLIARAHLDAIRDPAARKVPKYPPAGSRRWALRGSIGAVIAGGALFAAMKLGGDASPPPPSQSTMQVTAPTPPPPPAPEPAPAAEPAHAAEPPPPPPPPEPTVAEPAHKPEHKPVAHAAAPAKPATKPDKKKTTSSAAWDPNSLFAPK
jgi:serine/threonine-protein kinase